jgi:hypothetical protein
MNEEHEIYVIILARSVMTSRAERALEHVAILKDSAKFRSLLYTAVAILTFRDNGVHW